MVHFRNSAGPYRYVFASSSHNIQMREVPVRRFYNVKMAIPDIDIKQRENRARRNALRVAMNYDVGLARSSYVFGFFENAYLQDLKQSLRTNMLFFWLRGDFGPMDRPVITRDVINEIYLALPSFLASHCTNYVMKHYCHYEYVFWCDLLEMDSDVIDLTE